MRPSLHDAFPDHVTSPDAVRDGRGSVDERDPHDLSLSPKHAARTSIVDNMLLSLDQFALNSFSELEDYRLLNSVLSSDSYNMSSPDSTGRGRYRGHTLSSSFSSEANFQYEDSVGGYMNQTVRGRRSNSSSNYQFGLESIGSPRSRDMVSSRGRANSRAHGSRKNSKGSCSSNIEFGPPLPRARFGSASERRSASFDYGTRQAFMSLAESVFDHDTLPYNGIDAAPTPSVPAGPSKQHSASHDDYPGSVNSLSNPLWRNPVLSRRNSLKSTRTNHARKSHPENPGAESGATHDTDPENGMLDVPPSLPASLDPSAPSPTISFNKSYFPQVDAASTRERPGFFRRVFGSSKNLASGPADQAESQYRQEIGTKASDGSRTNPKGRRQMPHVVNKKPSFFRRRKKSVADTVPPPVVLPPEFNGTKAAVLMKPEPSPVSSLRKVMDPYIGDCALTKGVPATETNANDVENKRTSACAETQKQRDSAASLGAGQGPGYSLYPTVSSRGRDRPSYAGASGTRGSVTKSSGTDTSRSATSSQKLDEPQNTVSSPVPSPAVEDFSPKGPAGVEVSNNNPEREAEESEEGKGHLDRSSKLPFPIQDSKQVSPRASAPEVSNHYTASNTREAPKSAGSTQGKANASDASDASDASGGDEPSEEDREQARKLFAGQDGAADDEPTAGWLGEPDRTLIRKAYMELFEWSNMNILVSLRDLCTRLVLKGETQQVDRVLDAFSNRWCECNPHHGFKATGMYTNQRTRATFLLLTL